MHGFSWLGSFPWKDWFPNLPFVETLPGQIATAIIVMLFLLVTSVLAVKKITGRSASSDEAILPDRRFSLFSVYDLGFEKLYGLVKSTAGDHADGFFPIIATSFIYIFVCNLLGIIPGFTPPTLDINHNAACAIVIFVATHYFGFREHGPKYIKHFMGPVKGLAVLMLVIEVISHCVRPMSLSLRLFGNITGDHKVLEGFFSLVPLVVPVVFLGFGIWVSFLQAFIFTMLSIVYLSMAVSHDH